MQLYLVRHAEAASGEPDELRTLTPAGREAARKLGQRLADDGVRPEAVLSSPLLRARETADAIAKAAGLEAETHDLLLPGATADDVLGAVEGRGATVVVVGHQPDCGRVTAALTGGPEPPFPPAGIARIDLPA